MTRVELVPTQAQAKSRLQSKYLLAIAALIIGLAFLGSRGIWDPDEGRYTNVALNMLETGDWINPMRNDHTGHWTKPPLTYWTIAASVGVFGSNPFAARLPMAVSFLMCVFLVWRMAKRLAPGAETTAALAFSTMIFPVLASHIVTTDFVLTAMITLAMAAYVETRFGPEPAAKRWNAVMWVAFALAVLTKGPPGLVPILAIAAFEWWVPRAKPHRVFRLRDIGLFLLIALPWFVIVTTKHPGLLQYFLGAEIIDRVATDNFKRNGEWFGWLKVYGPTLVLGTMPWTFVLWRWLKSLPSKLPNWRHAAVRFRQRPEVFLLLWIAIPLVVFCLSRSRLPLYILPLFVPMAILVARQRWLEGRDFPRLRWIALGVMVLSSLQLATAVWPTHKNAQQWADAIRDRAHVKVKEVVFIEDMARYGIHLHLGAEIEKLSLKKHQDEQFNPSNDHDLVAELDESEPSVVYITKQALWPKVERLITRHGFHATALGEPYQNRIMFNVHLNAEQAHIAVTEPKPRGDL